MSLGARRSHLVLLLLAACGTSGRRGGVTDGGSDAALVDGGAGGGDLACATCGACTPGTRTCSGSTVQRCGSDGAYHDEVACLAGTVCSNGLCDDVRCADEMMMGGEFSLPLAGWPRFRHDNRNSGWNSVLVADQPKLAWAAGPYGTRALNAGSAGMASGPVVNQNNVVFVGAGDGDGQDGAFYALDAQGKQLWSFPGKRGYGYTTPAVRTDGTSYFSSQDGNAYAVDKSGVLAWKFPFGMQDDCSPIVTKSGNVIYGSDTHELFALDFGGKQLWQSDPNAGPGEVDAALAETCDGRVLAGGSNGWSAIDAKTGATLWRVSAGGGFSALMSSPLVDAAGTMYGVDSAGTVVAIDATGHTTWSKTLTGGAGTSMAKIGHLLLAVLGDGNLHALDAGSGAEAWSAPVGELGETYKHGGPVVDGRQRIYYASSDGNLYCFDTTGKQLWKMPVSGKATPNENTFGEMAIGSDGTLYVPGNDGLLYAFR